MLKSLVIIISLGILSACSVFSTQTTLYEQLGGKEGIEKLTDSFIKEIVNDEAIFPYFAKSNVTRFRRGFATHICDVSDGPCEYTGDSMQDVHTGMNISEAHFNRTVELLVAAMEANDISYPVQNELLSRLAPMRKEVYKR